ncbi:MAG: type II toxin-antitoxin system Phd/YefM family antitoxin [Desulfobaccales bacterium]
MIQVGASEARTHFAQLLDRVAQGERIIITRHGTPVAELVPVKTVSREQVREVVKALKAFREKHPLGDLSIREMIEEGRM